MGVPADVADRSVSAIIETAMINPCAPSLT